MAMAEIEVLGGGIFGLSVAYALQKRQARVRLIEKRAIGAGASGGVVGALAPHTPDNWNDKKQFQYESLIASKDFWAEVDAQSGIASGYTRIGRLLPIDTARELELAQARVISARTFWQGTASWQVVKAAEFSPWAPATATGFLVHETLSARLSPIAAVKSLSCAFVRLGGELVLGEDKARGADALVLCTGYEGLAELSDELGVEIGHGVKGQGMLLDYSAAGLPQIFAEGLHVIPHTKGVAIGSTSEREWTSAEETDAKLDSLHAQATGMLPVLADAPVLRRWAGVRPRGRRRAPMLGAHPGRKNTFVANGGFKIGFGVAVKVGQVMADLVLTGAAEIPESFGVEANLG
jgi:glycine oxidase